MHCRCLVIGVLVSTTISVAGCNKDSSPQTDAESLLPPSVSQANDNSTDIKRESSEFAAMFAAMVKGSLPNASEQDEQVSWEVLEKIEKFDKNQNKAFLEFLEGQLDDTSPWVRMEAGFNVALIRCDLGIGEKNEDLIPLFVELLNHEDVFVRKFAMNDMDPVVRNSNLGDRLQPLVPVLIETLEEPFTTYQAIAYLGDIGPVSREAIPMIRMAAARDNDKTIDQASKEAIRKIVGDVQ